MATTSCACVDPQLETLRNIYCVIRQLAGSPSTLADCACVRQVNDLLDNIYCAARIWAGLN
jgi:hypothetical protein